MKHLLLLLAALVPSAVPPNAKPGGGSNVGTTATTSTANKVPLSTTTAGSVTFSTSLLANPSDGNWVMENAAANGGANLFLGPTGTAHMPWFGVTTDAVTGVAVLAVNDTSSSTTTSAVNSGPTQNGTTGSLYAGNLATFNSNYGLTLENGGGVHITSASYTCWTNSSSKARGSTKPFNVCISEDGTSTGHLQLYDDTAGAFVGDFGTLLWKTVPSVDFNVGTKTTLITVPTGRTLVVDHIFIRNPSTSLTTASCSFGQDASAADWSSTATHTGLTGSTKYDKISGPTSTATTAAATAAFGVKCTILQGGAATVTIDLYYYLF